MDAMVSNLDETIENPSSVPLMVVENGCGSPCIDLRQVSSELAAAAKEADLVCDACSISRNPCRVKYCLNIKD